jgi:ribosomal protein S25
MIQAYLQLGKEIPQGEACSWNKFRWRLKVSVKRRDLIRYLEEHGFYLLREGSRHSIYTNNTKSCLSSVRES